MRVMMKSIVSWWHSERSFFPKVEFLMLFCTALFAIQVCFGWWRRCSSSQFIKYTLWLAYTCTPLLATYTFGFMNTSFVYSDRGHLAGVYLLYWSFTLLLALGSTYSLTAYDVDDNKQYMRHIVRNALYVLNMFGITRFFRDHEFTLLGRVALLLYLLIPVCGFTNSITNKIASSSSDNKSLYLQDYMKKQHLESTSYDPVTLEGYNYLILFKGSPNKKKDITVSQVWLSNGGLLGRSDRDSTRLKEVCLSYALYHLLKRRFFGADCPEAKLQKTHDLVLKGLLSNVEANYMSAYMVIETELAFIHDHFFITSPHFGPLIVFSAIGKVVCNLMFLTASFTMSSIIAPIVLLVLSALELLQIYIYLSSNFLKVMLACMCITPQRNGIGFQILRVCNKLPQLFGCWQNKIGQHSLLKDLHNRSITSDVIGSMSCISWFVPLAFPRGICNPGVKGADHTSLTNRVKKAIAKTLKSSDGRLSNGTSSLEWNGQVQLSQEFLLGSHAGDLLIWHIATEYCDMAQSLQTARQDDLTASNHDVATRLSSYCAYLIVFVPELLPDHQLETTAMFHRARKEALKHLHGDRTLSAKYNKLRNYYGEPSQSQQGGNTSDDAGQPPPQNRDINHGHPPPQDGDMQDVNVFEKGIQLGKRLEGIPDNGTRWKILADFWTEMILYIAPSDNARDHIQHLANGGEFITHLWALLTHAGILERPPQKVVNVQNAGAEGFNGSATTTEEVKAEENNFVDLEAQQKQIAMDEALAVALQGKLEHRRPIPEVQEQAGSSRVMDDEDIYQKVPMQAPQ